MSSLNKVFLLGNITRDVEVKYLQSGMAVTELGLAVNDKRKDQSGQWIEDVTFLDVTAWGRTAEIAAEYLSKGSSVLIEGRLKLDTWESEGQKRSKLKVVCENMRMLGSKGPRDSQEREPEPRQERKPSSQDRGARNAPPPGDDIPFSWLIALVTIGGQLPWLL